MVDSAGLKNRVQFLGVIQKVAPVLAAFDVNVLTSCVGFTILSLTNELGKPRIDNAPRIFYKSD